MPINKRLLEVNEFNGPGYKPLIDFGEWRVAILNYLEEIHPENISMFERHNQTDEVFVLMHGSGILFLGDGSQHVENIFSQELESGKLYNVKKSTWHSIVLSRDGSVLIVENQDTSRENSDYSPLLPQHRQTIIEISRQAQPGEWEK
jgi:mannose-6-phosphate isomerase-like protein (cupin superfamily)